MCVWMWVKPQRIDWKRQRLSLAVMGGVLVICHWVRYPDKAIREKQILQPHGFSSPVHSDELLKNGVQLKLVLYAGLQICLLSGLLPPVFIDWNGLLINLLWGGEKGAERIGVTKASCLCLQVSDVLFWTNTPVVKSEAAVTLSLISNRCH